MALQPYYDYKENAKHQEYSSGSEILHQLNRNVSNDVAHIVVPFSL
jgi:hypothetical protein